MIFRSIFATLLCATLAAAVQNVKVQGADFVNNVTSNRLQIIGVALVFHQVDFHAEKVWCELNKSQGTNQVDRLVSNPDLALILSATGRYVCVMQL